MNKHNDAQHLIAKLLTLPGAPEIAQSHRWAHEGDRRHELFVSLLTRTISLPESHVRTLVNRLRALNLLELSDWAALDEDNDGTRTVELRTVTVLEEGGVATEEAKRAAAVIRETADTVQKEFGGKIQRLLRRIGDHALAELIRTFDVPSLSKVQVREALAFWLQNVANLPISIEHASTDECCRTHKLSRKDLFDAADDLDLNVAVLDDLVHYYVHATAYPEPSAAEPKGERENG